MTLKPLTLEEKPLFERYLAQQPHRLCSYSFQNTWVWRSLFDIRWDVINGKFCLFFKDTIGCFMNLPPLGGLDAETLKSCFEIMENCNHNKDISRIENIEEGELGFFRTEGFRVYEKSREYIVSQDNMATLRGEKFKHKRSPRNYFMKNYGGVLRDYDKKDQQASLELYRAWMNERLSKKNDGVYAAMLKDSFKVFADMLSNLAPLNMAAKVVEVNKEIKAFSSGFPISDSVFCINFEISDLSLKGIASFIFCEFSKTLTRYPEINIMDDSGLENIGRVKLSYKPVRTVSSFTAVLDN